MREEGGLESSGVIDYLWGVIVVVQVSEDEV